MSKPRDIQPLHHVSRKSRRTICHVLRTVTFVVGLDDLRWRCRHYDAALFDEILAQLEDEKKIVIADRKVFPIWDPVPQAEIIPFPEAVARPAPFGEPPAS